MCACEFRKWSEGTVGCPGAGVTGHKPPLVGVGTWTWVLGKSSSAPLQVQ